MICYHCENVERCTIFKELNSVSDNFSIDECKKYNDASVFKYRKIAEHDKLMRLIYDYFTNQLVGVSEKEAERAIRSNMMSL